MADTDPERDVPRDDARARDERVPADDDRREPVDDEAVRSDAEREHAADEPVRADSEDRRTAEVADDRGAGERDAAVPAAPAAQPVLEPAQQSAPAAPKRESNRLVGTAWVVLAAGIFQVVYFALLAGFIALLAGPAVVGAQLPQYFSTPFAWLPVLFFFLLFELTVLIFNRAGRFVYVVASLVVGLLVYVVSVLLISILLRGEIGDRATLEQAFLSPLFVLAGLAAREVMLWTGVAIGARGTRVRKRNRAAQQAYRDELAER